MASLYPQRDMAKKKWDFDPLVTGGNEDARAWITDAMTGSFSEDKAKAKEIRERKAMDAYWQQLADSLTEPARQQLLDDLRGWNEATWEHRQHPTNPRHPSKGRPGNGA